MQSAIIFLAAAFLSYQNGANDNFKGVATLFGSGITDYKKALRLATWATVAGSILSMLLAESLVERFSGKGLVPDTVAGSSLFLLSVALGAGLTVFIATLTGLPISTTHSLTGALVGAGLVAVGSSVNFAGLGRSFFLPLLFSPMLATSLGSACYVLLRKTKSHLALTDESCLCVTGTVEAVEAQYLSSFAVNGISRVDATLGTNKECARRSPMFRAGYASTLTTVHYVSAGLVSFARGLNDTPKIVAILLGVKAMGIEIDMLSVTIAMAAGGWLSSRKVAETMSLKITPLSQGQGIVANLVTSFLVVFASRWGLPVSTTHVSVGSLFGIGLVAGKANSRVVYRIILSWVFTLPVAAIWSGGMYWLIQNWAIYLGFAR